MSRPAARAEVPYGRLDRLLHRLAFASLDMQRNLGEIENRLRRGRFDPSHAARPVFVTSLPRAGTTIMLDVLASLPDFASATYRQMPLPLAPLIWSDLSRRFRRGGEKAERAHGDGIAVSVDSPEAFEEPVWRAFWPEHYGRTHIRPWRPDAEAGEFRGFMRQHMAKIVAARGVGACRYLSKNNANIARLGLLRRLFPDATVVIPVRSPWAQAASLMRQHRRFSELHAREPFARRYMEDLGHFEFGAALRPIAFGSPAPDPAQADTPEFWLGYWCDAYESVAEEAGEGVVIVDHDALSRQPAAHLPALAVALGLEQPDRLEALALRFRPPREVPPPDVPRPLLDRARAIHARLLARALPARPSIREAS